MRPRIRKFDFWHNQLAGPTNPAVDSGWDGTTKRKGFFTDTSICIGCKACEVACKEWNHVPMRTPSEHGGDWLGSSYDNSFHLGADTWRHVAFVEQSQEAVVRARRSGAVALGMPGRYDAPEADKPAAGCGCGAGGGGCGAGVPGQAAADFAHPQDESVAGAEPWGAVAADGPISVGNGPIRASETTAPLPQVRWLMSSDVCKHCTHAGCLDVCPTGALFRTEFGTVVVQADICNGCGYCVASCPFGVIGRRENGVVQIGTAPPAKLPNGGLAQKCTLCYDRLKAGQRPACAQACPTTSIKFGDHDEMVKLARERLAVLHAQGHTEARLYGANPDDGVGGTGSIFLLLDDPEVYGLPPDPVVTTTDVARMFTMAGFAGTAMIGVALAVFGANGRKTR